MRRRRYVTTMTDEITARQFHESEGVDDWRVLYKGASAHYRTGSFAKGVALVDAIGELADAANHHPDVDLRYGSLTVRLMSHDVRGLSRRDVELARQISSAARDLGVEADPSAVQEVDLTINALSTPAVRPFWQTLLDYREGEDDDVLDPRGRGPIIWFQSIREPRTERNRMHVDVYVPHDGAEARIAAAVEAGGRVVSDAHAPAWWTLADPEGNEADVATWMGGD